MSLTGTQLTVAPMILNPSWLGGGVHLPPFSPHDPQVTIEEYRRRYPTACESCISARRGRYCLEQETVCLIGSQCDRAQVMIAGRDIRALYDRVLVLEQYVQQLMASETERLAEQSNSNLPHEIAVTIAKYF